MPAPPRQTFQIGWICALPIEAAAAKEMLDENFGILEFQDAADTNTYTSGRIGKHHVVIACLPGGQYGMTSATTVANNMLRTFSSSLRIGLMVGIGGGIPSAAHDIRLGDIVISYPQGTSGGVLQYDMGKVGVGGEFHRTGSLNSPPRSLLTALSSMRANELTDDPLYPEYIRRATKRTTRTRRSFARPDIYHDRLFKPHYEHPAAANSCDACLLEWEETREKRESSDPQPHYGIIASGSSVIKNGNTREQLRLQTGALCFEMEAAGLMMDFPCIVIRGVCDYADSHKNKQWQGYAALAAASYTKELLGYIPKGHVSQEELVVDVCNELKEEIQGTNQRLDRAYDQQEQHFYEQKARVLTDRQQKCHQAFKIANYMEQKNINPTRAEGTCQWALQSPEYLRWWKSRCNDLLWVSADPGCGKSVLAKSIIDDHLQDSNSGITTCYFFFKDNAEQDHLAIALCSILHQLFIQQPSLLQHALPSWEKNGEKIRQDIEELWQIFLTASLAGGSCKIICILDALDECREVDQHRLIEKLSHFHSQRQSSAGNTWLKFFVTSRPYNDIQLGFRAITDAFPQLHLKGEEENDQIHEEIDLVVKMRVKDLAQAARLSPETQQRLEHQLLQMEHRTYLWLYLAIDDIRTTFTKSLWPSKQIIERIPSSVNAAYEKILSRVPTGEVTKVRRILQIIVAARRPLTIQEMAMALGIALQPKCRFAAQASAELEYFDEKLRQLCGLFVFIKNSKIYLIHQTAREFLIGESTETPHFAYSCKPSENEQLMARICLQYLLMEDLEDDGQKLLEYSAVHWPDHVRKMTMEEDQEVDDLLHDIYNTTGKVFSLWFPLFWKAMMPDDSPEHKVSPIHLAAINGHEKIVRRLLAEDDSEVNKADSMNSYPLMWASLSGYKNVVKRLLNHGADVNAHGGKRGNALQAACVRGHNKVVQVLLEHGADVNQQGGFYGNSLQAACHGGHDKIVQVLLEHGADVNQQGGFYGNALHAAYGGGHNKVVQVLLEHGADINQQGGFFGNTFQAACCGGHDKIVQVLLDHGADVNAQGGVYGNALQAACGGGHNKVVQVLLDHGADVNTQGGVYGNALQAACERGYDKIMQVLLDHGADVNAQGGMFPNALHAACDRGHDKIVRVLLDHGAEVNGQGGLFGNALQAACDSGHDKIVQMLLENEADANSQGSQYRKALHTSFDHWVL
ncbi:uncharacterized protein N7482_007777 [Penicillium canariense]|uniref:Nucleoside phosphorylase domain-containing protein n=1 Tax=Penicillium canariense TaxID=189055 RepID=A0A9W9LKL0_9EURO|nr:uncharacterized protein N7482_007777 [Penicillium canariense]KAJ5160773.1 hypothetical protein N7482_007777 [Penicillium canariense]